MSEYDMAPLSLKKAREESLNKAQQMVMKVKESVRDAQGFIVNEDEVS
jgi:hypothetical protein